MARLPGKDAIYRAADLFRVRALGQGNSLIWPTSATWDADTCGTVSKAIIDNLDEGPGTFMEKLELQLQGKGEASYRIAADVLALYYLFPSNISADTKTVRLGETLAWLAHSEPQGLRDVEAAFAEGGIGGAGIYYNMGQPWQFTFFLRFAERALREQCDLNSSLAVKALALAVEDEAEFKSGAGPNVILHLLFPDQFERIASKQHKEQIVAALGTGNAVDLDDALFAIRQRLEATYPRAIDFYDPEIRKLWGRNPSPPPPPASPRVWIEKTLVAGRDDRQQGEYALGKMLWSPQAGTNGADIYGAMREVRRGDVVLHLTDNEAFVGISRAATEAEEFGGVPGTAWADRPSWRIKLDSYSPLQPTLSRTVFFAPPWKQRLITLLDNGLNNTFYNREPSLNQGKYLTAAPDSLVAVLSDAYRATAGHPLPLPAADQKGPPPPEPRPDLAACATNFSEALQAARLDFGPGHSELVRAVMASLAAKGFVILTGLSGSGKSQVALRLGQWFGVNRFTLVPVRPDWTGPDSLFGYEDALRAPKQGRRAWHVPHSLAFMLKAAADPANPYLLVLDEMNLAHVERYFADALSGMESRQPCVPNLGLDDEDAVWRDQENLPALIPFPRNLFIIGTVNVDETTYLFSPKVLDRANTFEFRVPTSALSDAARLPGPVAAGPEELVRGFMAIAQDDGWHTRHAPAWAEAFSAALRNVHILLSEASLEFGHRVYYEASRFAALYASSGQSTAEDVLDRVIIQKVLPRIHGSRKRVEVPLCALATFCRTLVHASGSAAPGANTAFNTEEVGVVPRLPLSYDKVVRMLRTLRANQFTSFTD